MILAKQKLKKYFTDREGRLTQDGLASILGCSKAYMNKLLNDGSKPGRHLAGMLEYHTGIEVGDWDKEADDA